MQDLEFTAEGLASQSSPNNLQGFFVLFYMLGITHFPRIPFHQKGVIHFFLRSPPARVIPHMCICFYVFPGPQETSKQPSGPFLCISKIADGLHGFVVPLK